MPGPVTDARAYALREQYHRLFGGHELPVPVESIAEDMLGLHVDVAQLEFSGLLLPEDRRVIVNAGEPESRRRFTLAHEVGHWVCQVLAGHRAPIYCRALDLLPEVDKALEREANVFAAELLMPEPEVRAVFTGSIADCAAAFGASDEAIHWRLYNIGLAQDPPRPAAPPSN